MILNSCPLTVSIPYLFAICPNEDNEVDISINSENNLENNCVALLIICGQGQIGFLAEAQATHRF